MRGGILDVYPAGEAQPVRLEFVGDTIESLRTYDPATQRSAKTVDRLTIVPLRDRLPLDNREGSELDYGATLFDYLARIGQSRIVVSERDEVEAHALKLVEQVQRSYEEAGSREPTTAVAPEALFVDWREVEARLAAGTEVAELAFDGSHVRCQPAIELRGRVADWVAEIRRLRGEGDTTLFVAATPGRAERTIELLKEYERLAAPVDRAEDARYAAVLVAIGTLSRGFRLPEAGLQIYAETDVFDEERRGPERRRPASAGFSLGPPRSEGRAISSCTSITASARSSASGRLASARRCRSSSSFATPATTSCSCRSSGSISSRSTRAPHGRRSIGSAARPGSAPRRESRRPCATWPRSC